MVLLCEVRLLIGASAASPTLANWLEDSRYVCMYVWYVRDSVYLYDQFNRHCIPLVNKDFLLNMYHGISVASQLASA